jgi:N utilization substance protein A
MNTAFIEALHDIEREKGIAKSVLIEAIEAALISAYKRNFQSAHNVRVDIDRDTGVVRVLAKKVIVAQVLDDRTEIDCSRAHAIDASLGESDTVEIEVTPKDFGRIAAQTAKQVVTQRIREAERGIVFATFVDREEHLITGIVHRMDARNVFVDIGKAEAVLPLSETMPSDRFSVHDRLKAFILKVDAAVKGPIVTLSRIHPGLVRRLFELEVPEIATGVVKIHTIARDPGSRSKLAVYTQNDDVDPIGACVGPQGTRVQPIIAELRGEKMDIVLWNSNPAQFVANALSPARVLEVTLVQHEKLANVIVPDHQLTLAIGIKGQNVRLAVKLTGWRIEIKSESEASEQDGRVRTALPLMHQDCVSI